MKHFTITRDKAAELLGISTRTIDRYIKSWKLGYKKVANKVFLAVEEVDALKSEFAVLHQEVSTELISESDSSSLVSSEKSAPVVKTSVDTAAILDRLDKFSLMLVEKDKNIEEKTKLIRVMQARISELETKIQSMIALPQYNEEKQAAIEEKKMLEEKLDMLKERLKEQETKTIVLFCFAIVLLVVGVFLWKIS